MKVKVNFSQASLTKALKVTPPTLLEMSEFWARRIYSFTKLGISLATGERLKPLSSAYKKRKSAYLGPKGELFGPRKSNLTLTGQLLKSIRSTANSATQRIFINLFGTRDDGLTNSQLGEYVSRQGRPFLGLDVRGEKRMAQFILRDIRRTFKKRKPGK